MGLGDDISCVSQEKPRSNHIPKVKLRLQLTEDDVKAQQLNGANAGHECGSTKVTCRYTPAGGPTVEGHDEEVDVSRTKEFGCGVLAIVIRQAGTARLGSGNTHVQKTEDIGIGVYQH